MSVGAFTASITGLTPNTLYYVRAYASNTAGTVYGSQVSFNALPQAPQVTTQTVTDIGTTTATGNGNITNLGIPNPSAHGVCWNTAGSPTTSDSFTDKGAAVSVGAFTASMTGLSANTTYYVRAYASNTAGTAYGSQVSFNALPQAPVVTTQQVTVIGTTTATGNGNITDLGIPNPSAHGVCWNTTGSPTTSDSLINKGAAVSVGAFTASMTGLSANTTYYVRAYASNTAGTAYGSQVNFTTLPQAPTVSTQPASDIGPDTATGHGTINLLGAPNPTQHGVCWGTMPLPTILDSKTEQGPLSAIGSFTSSMTGLIPNTTYYARAYATNTAGTAYGGQVGFTTLPQGTTLTTQAVSAIGTTTATGNGNVTVLGIPSPTQHGVCWNTSPTPTIFNNRTLDGPVTATGAFTSNMTGLSPYTTYYVRAYATNTAGTTYGNQVIFDTLPLPSQVSTRAVDGIGTTSATANGTLDALGIPDPTQHGFCWSTETEPTVDDPADDAVDLGPYAGTVPYDFSHDMTGLSPYTTYYVRAYAVNASGTVYGAEVYFESNPKAMVVETQAATGIDKTTATGNGSIVSLGAPNPIQHGLCWSMEPQPAVDDLSDSKTELGSLEGFDGDLPYNFTSELGALTPGTVYYVRAYATNELVTVYGGEQTFTTLKDPVVTTQAVTDIGATTATGNGTIVDLGVPNPEQHGVCWSIETGTGH